MHVFKNLGFVVTDEQHRFGVKQRTTIVEKGQNPDVLVMTATPIPRTLALILYGDLDISIIDELPPNRKKIDTFAVTKGMEERVNNFIKKQVDEGRQAYIVCPLVEENEEMNLKSVTLWQKNIKMKCLRRIQRESWQRLTHRHKSLSRSAPTEKQVVTCVMSQGQPWQI